MIISSKTKTTNQKTYIYFKATNTVLESVGINIIIGATPTSIILSIAVISLIVLSISAGNACILSLGNKVLHKLILNKYNKYKKQSKKDQQTKKSFDNLYRKSLKDNGIYKNE